MRHTRVPASVLLFTLLAWAAPATAEVTPTVVVASEYHDLTPAATADYLAWSTEKPLKGDRYRQGLFVQPTGGEPYRVNPSGTWGYKPEIEGTLLAYTEAPYGVYDVTIRFYDLATDAFVDPPAGMDSKGTNEWWPSISGDLLLFLREDPETSYEELVVLDLVTGESQVLATSKGWRRFLLPGQIDGDLVVWSKQAIDKDWITWLKADVYVHDLSTGVTTTLANPGPKFQFGPSVDAAGTIFYGRAGAVAGTVCGRNSRLMSAVPGEEPTVLVSFEPGQDFFGSYARDNADGSTTVFFDPGTCTDSGGWTDADIWSIEV